MSCTFLVNVTKILHHFLYLNILSFYNKLAIVKSLETNKKEKCLFPGMGEIRYRISSYSFRGNYSFLNLEIQRSHYIRPKVTVNKGSETIQERKLFEEIYGIRYRYKLLATLSTNGQ